MLFSGLAVLAASLGLWVGRAAARAVPDYDVVVDWDGGPLGEEIADDGAYFGPPGDRALLSVRDIAARKAHLVAPDPARVPLMWNGEIGPLGCTAEMIADAKASRATC